MAIQNDFLEFLQQPRCKTALLIMTVFIFVGLFATELSGKQSAIFQELSKTAFIFWVARATKKAGN